MTLDLFPEFTHPTAQALYAHILADPDDDAPRLIFADWLDEHGDAEAANRASFIRLHIRVAALLQENAPQSEVDALVKPLIERFRLFDQHWLYPVAGLGPIPPRFWGKDWFCCERAPQGFLHSWRSSATYYLEQAAAVFGLASLFRPESDQAPIPNDWFLCRGFLDRWITTPRYFREWAPTVLARVPLTHLSCFNKDLTDFDVQHLAECPYLLRLHSLSFGNCSIGDAAARALAESPYLIHLTELSLYNTYVTERGARFLVESPYFDHLRQLNLGLK